MLANVISLETAKQRRFYLSTLIAIAGSVIFLILEAKVRNRELNEIISAWFLLLLTIGMPALAVLFGSMGASGLYKERQKNAEEGLPIPAFTRVLGAYLTSLVYLSSIGIPLLFVGESIGSLLFFNQFQFMPKLAMAAVGVLYLHLLSFVLTYWLKESFLAIVLSLATVLGHFQILKFFDDWSGKYAFAFGYKNVIWKVFAADTLISISAAIFALAMLAKAMERGIRISFLRGVSVCLMLLTGLLFCLGVAFQVSRQLDSHLSFDSGTLLSQKLSGIDRGYLGDGIVIESLTGTKVLVDSNGKRQILFKSPFRNDDEFTSIAFLEQNGSAWVIANSDRQHPRKYVLLHASPGQPIQDVSRFESRTVTPTLFYFRGDQLVMFGWSPAEGRFLAAVPFQQGPNWKPVVRGDIFQGIAAANESEGVYAVLDQDSKILRQSLPSGIVKEWQLPGTGYTPFPFTTRSVPPASGSGDQSAFTLPVSRDHSTRLMVCKPDGTVTELWNVPLELDPKDPPILRSVRIRRVPIPGGTAWLVPEKSWWGPYRQMLLQNSDGAVFPPLDVKNVYKQTGIKPINDEKLSIGSFDVRRVSGSRLWVLLEGNLVQVDLNSGKVLKISSGMVTEKRVDATISPTSTKEGIYFIAGNHLRLMSWDGHTKDLGPASLQ